MVFPFSRWYNSQLSDHVTITTLLMEFTKYIVAYNDCQGRVVCAL